jgi:SAM-dependent methyltransferase
VKVCLVCEARFDSEGWRCPECGSEPVGDGILRFPTSHRVEESFPEESFADLPGQEEKSFWFRGRGELIAWALERYFPEARSFFEVGCGTGVVLATLRERHPALALAGGEPFAAGLETASARLPGVPLYVLDGRALPFEAEFDVVGAFDVLEHVDEDELVLAQMRQAVKPGGGILVSVPQHPWLWSAVDEFSRHRRRYRGRELVEKVERAGFEVVRTTSFVSLLLPVVALSRWRDRGRREYDPSTEYRLPARVDRAFGGVLGLERGLIERGVSFPAGSSLLLVARTRRRASTDGGR